jgi:ubiquinone/menaquinone biosynthesis C-methylase UbiE
MDKNRSELLKEYFKNYGTVSKWWEPELKEGTYKEKYVQERVDVISLTKPKGKTVLDVGTGKGRFAISFVLNGAKKVTACDLSPEMLNIASKRTEEARVQKKIIFELGDAERLKYKDESFDIVCCMQVFPHIPNPQSAINELARVCKVGGIVIADAIVYNYIYRLLIRLYYLRFAKFLRKFGNYLFGKPLERLEYKSISVVNYYSKKEFLSLFKKSNLKNYKIKKYDPFFAILAKKLG